MSLVETAYSNAQKKLYLESMLNYSNTLKPILQRICIPFLVLMGVSFFHFRSWKQRCWCSSRAENTGCSSSKKFSCVEESELRSAKLDFLKQLQELEFSEFLFGSSWFADNTSWIFGFDFLFKDSWKLHVLPF